MPYSLNYGTPFGGPAVGAAVFEAAKESTDFARSVENNRILLERRRVALEEAKHVAQLRADQLQARRWDKEFARHGREFAVQAEHWRESRKIQTRQEDRFDREFGERSKERLTARADQWRQERNGLLSLGGRQVQAGEKLPPGYFPARGPDGKTWAVPTKRRQEWESMRDELKKQEAELKLKQKYAPPVAEKPPTYSPWQKQRISNIKGKLSALSGDMERRLRERDELGARIAEKRGKITPNLSDERRRPLEAEVARMEKDLAALPTREAYLAEREALESELSSITNSLLPEAEQRVLAAGKVAKALSAPEAMAKLRRVKVGEAGGDQVLELALSGLRSQDEAERLKAAELLELLAGEVF